MAWWKRPNKRRVPTPQLLPAHRSVNPMFSNPEPTSAVDWAQWRQRILLILAGLIMLGSLGTVVYGPWLRVDAIDIKGTVAIQPQSLKTVTQTLLDQRRWLIAPNRNLWLLSSGWLAKQLRAEITRRLSIEGVEVAKNYPHGLTVTVHERTPAWRWQSGSQLAIVDRRGMVMSLTDAGQGLPLVVDDAAPILVIDQPVVKAEVSTAMLQLPSLLSRAQMKYTNFVIPAPTCPVIAAPAPTTSFQSNTNQIDNTNQTTPLVNAVTNANANISTTNTEVTTPPCDLGALHQASQEIHVQLDHGPAVYFDRHQDLSQAVTALDLILRRPNASAIHSYIDLRFLPRVYTK